MTEKLDLLRLFKGFVRNYGTLLLGIDTTTTYTHRELGHWMKLGEMMGYFTQQERNLQIRGETRRADLLWLDDDYETIVLHLEIENSYSASKLVKYRLNPEVPYLVAVVWADKEPNDEIFNAALELIQSNKAVKQILLVIWRTSEEDDDIHLLGARFTRRTTNPHIVRGRLRRFEHHKARLYYGILEEDWEDIWTCNFCGAEFYSKVEAVNHEKECLQKDEDL